MGLGFREVAKEITSALNLGEDEGEIDALAGSLQDAAIKSFGHSSELHTKLVSSLNQSSLQQSNRVKEFLDGERGGGTIITGELSPLQKEALERTMSPEQMESLPRRAADVLHRGQIFAAKRALRRGRLVGTKGDSTRVPPG